MNEAYYQQRIRNKQQELYGIEDELREKQRDLENLFDFKREHHHKVNEISQHFQARQQRLRQVPVNSAQVKFLVSYTKSMEGLLSEKDRYLQKKEDEQQEIDRGIRRVEQEIDSLRSRRMLCENQLSDLQYQLRVERMKKDE